MYFRLDLSCLVKRQHAVSISVRVPVHDAVRNADHARNQEVSSRRDRQLAAFPITRWSVVLAAGRQHAVGSREALNTLCTNYWRPTYAYVRRLGLGADDAQDMVQEFFTRPLEKNTLGRVHPTGGRFRVFLLTCLKHVMADARDRGRAQKRGGGVPPVSLDRDRGEIVRPRADGSLDARTCLRSALSTHRLGHDQGAAPARLRADGRPAALREPRVHEQGNARPRTYLRVSPPEQAGRTTHHASGRVGEQVEGVSTRPAPSSGFESIATRKVLGSLR